MSWLLKIIVLSLTLGAVSNAKGADSVNLLVMIEDADKHSVPRDSQINKRVHASISQQLNQVADVYDETSVTLNTFNQGPGRRTDAELLDIARSVTRPPIDIVVVLSTYTAVTTNEYAKKARARVAGKILNAKSGQFLDNFEVQSPRTWSIPYACDRQTCILEEMGDEAKVLGDELGLILAEKLNWLINAGSPESSTAEKAELVNDYYLEFDGFSAKHVANIEEYLLLFSGYVSHRPTQQRFTRTTLLYRSTTGTAMLSRNLLKLLEELNMRATINFEGNAFSIKRITLRGENANRDITEGW
ncbi:hypothetical protein [uncultured Paraglaciecola sp.]|uniref:hypothetical protein n=1 Tax=uncultured Paraglaciecola sp. TaxID=1765024 RepID=UPI0030D8090D|tara:strand:- start:69211 stop:70116 length:906 start_codon:yes stop_codon:yes gene_type:complete